MNNIHIGDIVVADYNSGVYIGKALEDRRNFMLVEVLAVVKHPTQGDLHNPGKVEGVAFFERKALAFREKTNARKRTLKLFSGNIPSYSESLKDAVNSLKKELASEDSAYNQAALQRLLGLEEHYYNKIKF